MHKPISIEALSLIFSSKICFDDFNAEIHSCSKIAIIGRNGSGKTTILKILTGESEPTFGNVNIPSDVVVGYVPQIIQSYDNLSGGQKFNESFNKVMEIFPNLLLLDEPTNNLDKSNRDSLMRKIQEYYGTVIIVSHDVELLRSCVDEIWHIDNGKINIFKGNYDDYIREQELKRNKLERESVLLRRQDKAMHASLMQEQKRASKSKDAGRKNIENRKWPTVVSKTKMGRGSTCSMEKKAKIRMQRAEVSDKLNSIGLTETILPTFNFKSGVINDKALITVRDASVAYNESYCVLNKFDFSLHGRERIAIVGDNGSGKTTLLKAILSDDDVLRKGYWHITKRSNIAYLDQNYSLLCSEDTVFSCIKTLGFLSNDKDIRMYLKDYLFRTNDDVNKYVNVLSGGEKLRLCLALISLHLPALLILDEITNNIDLETRQHLIDVLNAYHGAILAISHDEDFLRCINIKQQYQIKDGNVVNSIFI